MSRRKLRLVVVAFALAVMMTLALISVASAEPALSGGYWYQVVPGDTWYGVSYKTGISYSTLWNANPAHQHWNNWLYIGHWLWIPSPPAPTGYWYQVRSGDTWYGLSRKTGHSWWTLWNANPAHQHWNNWLYVGHWLWIPYPPAPTGYWYQVQPGDTWYGLSWRTGLSWGTLWNANPAHHHWNNWLYIGHWLWIPN